MPTNEPANMIGPLRRSANHPEANRTDIRTSMIAVARMANRRLPRKGCFAAQVRRALKDGILGDMKGTYFLSNPRTTAWSDTSPSGISGNGEMLGGSVGPQTAHAAPDRQPPRGGPGRG